MNQPGASDAVNPTLGSAAVVAGAEARGLPRDFPDWLPPMLVKELRQGLRTRGFGAMFVLVQLALALSLLGALTAGAGTRVDPQVIEGAFWTVLGAVVLLLTPLRAFGTLRAEQDQRSLDLLVLTRLTPWRIVLGKWGSLQVQALLFVVALLPWGVVRYFFGVLDVVRDGVALLLMLAGGAVLTGMGVWASTLPKLLRIVLPIGVVLVVQMGVPVFFALRMGRVLGGATTAAGSDGTRAVVWALLNLALLGVVVLHGAVARIAPPAHNHAWVSRAAVWAWLGLAVVGLLMDVRSFGEQAVWIALVAAVLAGVVHLSDVRPARAIHAQPWVGGGWVRAAWGALWLPGLGSALAWWAMTVILGVGVCLVGLALGWTNALEALAVVPVLSAAVMAPAAVVRALVPRPGFSLAAYIALVVVCSILAGFVQAAPGEPAEMVLWPVVRGLPVLGLWMCNETAGHSAGWVAWDIGLAAVIGVWAGWLSRDERRRYAGWRRAARAAKAEATA